MILLGPLPAPFYVCGPNDRNGFDRPINPEFDKLVENSRSPVNGPPHVDRPETHKGWALDGD
jgi:hypothetical protein